MGNSVDTQRFGMIVLHLYTLAVDNLWNACGKTVFNSAVSPQGASHTVGLAAENGLSVDQQRTDDGQCNEQDEDERQAEPGSTVELLAELGR